MLLKRVKNFSHAEVNVSGWKEGRAENGDVWRGGPGAQGPSPAAALLPLHWAELRNIAYGLITGAPACWCH